MKTLVEQPRGEPLLPKFGQNLNDSTSDLRKHFTQQWRVHIRPH